MFVNMNENIHTWVTWQSKFNYQYSLRNNPEERNFKNKFLLFSKTFCILKVETFYVLQSSSENIVL